MQRSELQRSMYELQDASQRQRITMAVFAGLWILLAGWLLLGGGLSLASRWLPWIGRPGDLIRQALIFAGFAIYYIRILFTEFVFLRRGVSWSEVWTIVPWLLLIIVFLCLAGGTNPAPFAAAGILGVVCFVVGSWMNSYAEYARHVWKQQPENRGRLYTGGLFRYSRHPNYLGDLLLFSGLCLISGAWITAIIPLLMLAGFVFVNIPVLDSHLHDHYGSAFDDYARRTSKLIPFVY
jgi:protein-S-isoprenylcysteine O-methyltransferase Ste14